jgi:hypothetical protein
MTYQFFVNCRRVPEVSSSSSSLSSISWRPWFYCADAAAAAAAAAAAELGCAGPSQAAPQRSQARPASIDDTMYGDLGFRTSR